MEIPTKDIDNMNGIVEFSREKNGLRPVRVTVSYDDDGEIMYSKASKCGVVVSCEDIRMEAFGTIAGRQQMTLWGNPMGWFYSWDQLQQRLGEPEIKRQMLDAMKAANFHPGVMDAFDQGSRQLQRFSMQPDIEQEAVTIMPYMKGEEMQGLVRGFKETAGRDLSIAFGFGIQADLFDDGDRWVCPMIKSLNPGSGKLDQFLMALFVKLEKPVVFRNFTNARLRRHLERLDIHCED